MNLATKAKLVLSALVGAAAIGTLATPATADTASRPATVGPQQVATVTSAGVTVTFLAATGPDGQPQIGLQVLGRIAEAASSPVSALVAQKLTSQEIYLALSPQGATAPDVLVQAHAAEATALGRDMAVRTIRAAESPVGTLSAETCKAKISWPAWTGIHGAWTKSGATYSSGYHTRYVGGISGYQTTGKIGLAACNESSTSNMTAVYAYNQRWNNLGWQYGNTVDLPVGWYAHWYWQWYSGSTGASYLVNGSSVSSFSLATGEWEDIPS